VLRESIEINEFYDVLEKVLRESIEINEFYDVLEKC
jgi:hypothetical protein